MMVDAGLIVVTALISPFRAERRLARERFAPGEFFEVFVDTPIEVCEQRDPKGMYKRARAGQLPDFTGVSAPYEIPSDPDMVADGTGELEEQRDRVIDMLREHGVILV